MAGGLENAFSRPRNQYGLKLFKIGRYGAQNFEKFHKDSGSDNNYPFAFEFLHQLIQSLVFSFRRTLLITPADVLVVIDGAFSEFVTEKKVFLDQKPIFRVSLRRIPNQHSSNNDILEFHEHSWLGEQRDLISSARFRLVNRNRIVLCRLGRF